MRTYFEASSNISNDSKVVRNVQIPGERDSMFHQSQSREELKPYGEKEEEEEEEGTREETKGKTSR